LFRIYFFVVTPASSSWKNVTDLIAAAKAKRGELTYGSWFIGSPGHLGAALPQVKDGKLVALAVTSPERFPPMPNVMTQREGGVDSQYVMRFGFFAPRGTPEPGAAHQGAVTGDRPGRAAITSAASPRSR
jgi:tripartite-type tricarboxylate transporter receptor subunit TctC